MDPFDPLTWSGSSRFFFRECEKRGVLLRAFGVDAPRFMKYACALLNYSRNGVKWRRKFYMDVRYRRSLTAQIGKRLRDDDYRADFMQIGAMYDVPSLVRGRSKCFMYSDGNFAMSLRSPYFPSGISVARIDRTLAYEKSVYSRLDMIFTMSDYLRRSYMDDFGVDPERVVCIGAGCNLDELPAEIGEKDYGNGAVLFIGADFERKGGRDLLRAFSVVRAQVPHATLHIVGPPKPADAIAAPGIVWHGFLRKAVPSDAEVLNRLFQQATVFVMPSLYEPFGIAPMEAMSYAVPCIVSNTCALPETVKQGITGEVVECGQWEELAQVIVRLLKDPARLRAYGTAGRESVQQGGTWHAVLERMIAAMPSRDSHAGLGGSIGTTLCCN